jgi:hypothetical protein
VKKDLRFGFREKDIAQVKTRLESLLGIEFTERESSYYCGRYFRFESSTTGQFILQENFDSVENEWVEESHQDLPLLLNVSEAPESDKLRKTLTLVEGCRLINERER